ncbi:hypothetical protein EDM53_04685, partial [Rickettsiales endosymbiont of Peranema trichophorum]|uniref:hypothetical protein n=1 Tax=Rickettsiales endosymbiont of Peranema trichophorum TaxID=2486577 RepID=UPI0010233647
MMMVGQQQNVIYKLAKFITGNIPTGGELLLTSAAQSLVEIILDNTGLEQGFGNNPTAKSFMRDGAKIVTAPYYSYTNTPVGDRYVADTFTALGSVTKGPIKVATMSILKSASTKNVDTVDFTRLDKVLAHINFDPAVLNEVKSLYLQYAKDGSQLGTFSRLSNFIAEPITKTLEGCSKALQDEALKTGLEYRNTGVLDTIMNIKKFGIEQFIGYSLGNSLIKTSLLDLFGDYYGKMGIQGMLKSARETIEQYRVNFVFGRTIGGEFQIKHKMPLSHRIDMVNKAVDSAFQ